MAPPGFPMWVLWGAGVWIGWSWVTVDGWGWLCGLVLGLEGLRVFFFVCLFFFRFWLLCYSDVLFCFVLCFACITQKKKALKPILIKRMKMRLDCTLFLRTQLLGHLHLQVLYLLIQGSAFPLWFKHCCQYMALRSSPNWEVKLWNCIFILQEITLPDTNQICFCELYVGSLGIKPSHSFFSC